MEFLSPGMCLPPEILMSVFCVEQGMFSSIFPAKKEALDILRDVNGIIKPSRFLPLESFFACQFASLELGQFDRPTNRRKPFCVIRKW
jgi:hypothetical protein